MMKVVVGTVEKGVARELPASAEEVVAARDFRFQPETPQRFLNHRLLLTNIIVVFISNKREVEIPQIVINRSAPCAPSHQMSTFLVQTFDIAFRKRILVQPNHHSAFVFP